MSLERCSARMAACAVATLVALGCSKQPPKSDAPIKVAAAADLAFAFKDVGAAFEKKTGRKVTFTFGSTGLLAKQISEGAQYDVFAAANVSFVDDVVKAGACDGGTKAPYARGRIAIWTKTAGAVKSLADLTDPKFAKISIANPEHAPYGRAAQQALEKANVWETVKPRMVFGENVQQALQFAQTGNADVAIVALSLAMVTDGGSYVTIEESEHKPIEQALVVCDRGSNKEVGKEFATFVNSAEGRAVMKRFGFLLPGEAAAKAP